MIRATVTLEFEYDEANFDGELTDERVKDIVQDAVLGTPGLIYENTNVTSAPSYTDGLPASVLEQARETEPTETSLSRLDIGAIVSLDSPDGELYVLGGFKGRDSQDNTWALLDAETGTFETLIRDGAAPGHHNETVFYHGTYAEHDGTLHEANPV